MTAIREGLTNLFGELERLGAPVTSYLRPGLPGNTTRRLIEEAGLAAPDEVVDWFGVFDGFDHAAFATARGGPGTLSLFPRGIPFTLDEALEHLRQWRQLAEKSERITEGRTVSADVWPPGWLPLMYTSIERINVECRDSTPSAPVWLMPLDPDDPTPERLCPSLDDFVRALAQEVGAGAYRWDPDAGELRPADEEALTWPAIPRCTDGGQL
jgi:cell wall assembly regulator SMI1